MRTRDFDIRVGDFRIMFQDAAGARRCADGLEIPVCVTGQVRAFWAGGEDDDLSATIMVRSERGMGAYRQATFSSREVVRLSILTIIFSRERR